MNAPPVEFRGLGTMGGAMAANVARAGFPFMVWNRTPRRAAAALAAAAAEAVTPASVAAAAEIVVIRISDTPEPTWVPSAPVKRPRP